MQESKKGRATRRFANAVVQGREVTGLERLRCGFECARGRRPDQLHGEELRIGCAHGRDDKRARY